MHGIYGLPESPQIDPFFFNGRRRLPPDRLSEAGSNYTFLLKQMMPWRGDAAATMKSLDDAGYIFSAERLAEDFS
jgi:hypothetical protein